MRDQPGFPLRGRSGHYDGAFFYAVTRDPLATGQAHKLLPEPSYYWGHPAYGWLTWLASAGGQPAAVPDALLAVGLLSIFVAAGAASLLAGALGWSMWGGLVVALNPGLLFAVYSDTSEPLGAALLLLALVAYVRGRRGVAVVLFAALCFDKEPLVLVPIAIAAWEIWRTRRISYVAAAVVPAALWWLYLRVHLGAFPFGYGQNGSPLPSRAGPEASPTRRSKIWSRSPDTAQLGQGAVALIIGFGAAIIVAAFFALRLGNVVAPAFLALAALYACITPNGVEYPKDLIREVALVVTLLPFVFKTTAIPEDAAFARKYPRARLPFRQRPES